MNLNNLESQTEDIFIPPLGTPYFTDKDGDFIKVGDVISCDGLTYKVRWHPEYGWTAEDYPIYYYGDGYIDLDQKICSKVKIKN